MINFIEFSKRSGKTAIIDEAKRITGADRDIAFKLPFVEVCGGGFRLYVSGKEPPFTMEKLCQVQSLVEKNENKYVLVSDRFVRAVRRGVFLAKVADNLKKRRKLARSIKRKFRGSSKR